MGKLLDTSHHEPHGYAIFGEPIRRLRPVYISASATAITTRRGTTHRGMAPGGFERRPGLAAAGQFPS